MSEMIERACRAVATARGYDPDTPVMPGVAPKGPDGTTIIWRDPMPLWMTFARDVRATLEAVREPTDMMMDRGYDRLAAVSGDSLLSAWRSMIDVALAPPAENAPPKAD